MNNRQTSRHQGDIKPKEQSAPLTCHRMDLIRKERREAQVGRGLVALIAGSALIALVAASVLLASGYLPGVSL